MLTVAFLLISLLSLLLFYLGTNRNKRLILLFIIWQILIGYLALHQVFKEKPVLFPLAILGTVLLMVLSFKIANIRATASTYLLGIHILRIPVELVLYQLFLQEKIPSLMTFKGWNFDILIGISALAILMYKCISRQKINKHLFIIWNIAGLLSLLTIVSLAILSSPLPIQQLAFEQPNIAVLEFPYSFLPTCVVPIVLLSHILLIKNSSIH